MQFKLKTILIGVGVVALLSAVIAPWVRQLAPEQQQWVGIQAAGAMIGFGVAVGLRLLWYRRRQKRIGDLLISLRPTRGWSKRVRVLLFASLLLGSHLISQAYFRSLKDLHNVEKIEWFNSLVLMSAFLGGCLLSLGESRYSLQLYERGTVLDGMRYSWDALRYVRWNDATGDLSIAAQLSISHANVPIEDRASVTSLLERNCGAGVLTAVDPHSDQGRTLTKPV
jgi:hypothetical protein